MDHYKPKSIPNCNIVDFNARIQGWYQNNTTIFKGCKINIGTSQFGVSQMIKEPTYTLSNLFSCIDLIFTSQRNFMMHSGIHKSLHLNCHHQIVSAKFSLTNFDIPPWQNQQADTKLIKRVIELFDWEKSLSNLDVNKQVSVFKEAIMSIFKNFIPRKTTTSNDKDPPWMNKQIKTLTAEKKALYERLKRRMLNSKLFDKFDALKAKLQNSINYFEFEYHRKISKKLSNPSTSPKCYSTLLKTLLNGRKTPYIPPLFHDNKFITDFEKKSKVLNSFFAKQCSWIDNGSTLPSLFPLITEKLLLVVDFSAKDSNKAHGDDMISICMFKLCDKLICKPLDIIFKSCLREGSVVLIQKKNHKQCVKN